MVSAHETQEGNEKDLAIVVSNSREENEQYFDEWQLESDSCLQPSRRNLNVVVKPEILHIQYVNFISTRGLQQYIKDLNSTFDELCRT